MHPPERMPRRTFCATLCAAVGVVHSGCGARTGSLAGQIQWVGWTEDHRGELTPLDRVFGAAFLLLEREYKSLGYEGPPKTYPMTPEEARNWHRDKRLPTEWWYLSIPYEWWGRGSGTQPTEVTLSLEVPVHLLRAHLDNVGRFAFKDLPFGRHTLFIRWGKSADPQNNISGPYAVIIDKPGQTEQVFPVNAFDMIDT